MHCFEAIPRWPKVCFLAFKEGTRPSRNRVGFALGEPRNKGRSRFLGWENRACDLADRQGRKSHALFRSHPPLANGLFLRHRRADEAFSKPSWARRNKGPSRFLGREKRACDLPAARLNRTKIASTSQMPPYTPRVHGQRGLPTRRRLVSAWQQRNVDHRNSNKTPWIGGESDATPVHEEQWGTAGRRV